MNNGIDISPLYTLRRDFTVIGLTGRTGYECSELANIIRKGFVENEFPHWKDFPLNHNAYRKYRIVHEFCQQNFKPFTLIEYKHVLTLMILRKPFSELTKYLTSENVRIEFKKSKLPLPDFTQEIENLESLAKSFNHLHSEVQKLKLYNVNSKSPDNLLKLHSLFFSDAFIDFSNSFHNNLSSLEKTKRIKFLQIIANNLRSSGNPYKSEFRYPLVRVFNIVKVINILIKSIKYHDKSNTNPTQIVIDSLRNPLEILFFKERYSAFYMISVNANSSDRTRNLKSIYKSEYNYLKQILNEEYNGAKGNEFFKQKVAECIQRADIHISYLTIEQAATINRNLIEKNRSSRIIDVTSPVFSWKMQILKFIALIHQPGIVPPSPEERCMQFAYTAKYNSGCISRQVGAAITDENYSLKAVGWNNTPEGHVPCVLRNVTDLLDDRKDLDLSAFTPFEQNIDKSDEQQKFRETLTETYINIKSKSSTLKGRNVCFCFKSIKNSCSEGKNQVHTRSLHAEENAFLQISKYGGEGIKNGKLFTTASPCELCAKKAVQLGIKVIYYIDPYPGISDKQILQANEANQPEIRLFHGAIGNAYHWLYEPIMSYKDELGLILGQNIEDLATKQKNQLIEKDELLKAQEKQIIALEAKLDDLQKIVSLTDYNGLETDKKKF